MNIINVVCIYCSKVKLLLLLLCSYTFTNHCRVSINKNNDNHSQCVYIITAILIISLSTNAKPTFKLEYFPEVLLTLNNKMHIINRCKVVMSKISGLK